MSVWRQEQIDTLEGIRKWMPAFGEEEQREMSAMIRPYLDFRKEVDDFFGKHFGDICTEKCFRTNKSACCSRDGILTFFADLLINYFFSTPEEIDALISRLESEGMEGKCRYLGETGCCFRIKPLVCEMFLCESAQKEVFEDTDMEKRWNAFREKEKTFRWPDRPVLFDELESRFIKKGYVSPLMYCHNSPGLLRVKERSKTGTKIDER